MKLHDNQLRLIRHLIRFNVLDYSSCLKVLDTENTGDRVALSYTFRPLTKNDYISKNKKGIVKILQKGKALFPDERRLISDGSNTTGKERVLYVSRVAALMEKNGIKITDKLPTNRKPHFIPSACWRNIAKGILSTTRFAGILCAYDKKYAVYDIGNGNMEWQLRAESSLFYTKYGSYETKADGIIFICDDEEREKIAKNIIRQTMWHRRTLLEEQYTERKKPVSYSHSPIRLRAQYERVYLIERSNLKDGLKWVYKEEHIINNTVEDGAPIRNAQEGDVEVWPDRYFINPAYDLLKLVYFFSAVKMYHALAEKDTFSVSDVRYSIIMQEADLPIIAMYPDVKNSERVNVYVFKFEDDA